MDVRASGVQEWVRAALELNFAESCELSFETNESCFYASSAGVHPPPEDTRRDRDSNRQFRDPQVAFRPSPPTFPDRAPETWTTQRDVQDPTYLKGTLAAPLCKVQECFHPRSHRSPRLSGTATARLTPPNDTFRISTTSSGLLRRLSACAVVSRVGEQRPEIGRASCRERVS